MKNAMFSLVGFCFLFLFGRSNYFTLICLLQTCFGVHIKMSSQTPAPPNQKASIREFFGFPHFITFIRVKKLCSFVSTMFLPNVQSTEVPLDMIYGCAKISSDSLRFLSSHICICSSFICTTAPSAPKSTA